MRSLLHFPRKPPTLQRFQFRFPRPATLTPAKLTNRYYSPKMKPENEVIDQFNEYVNMDYQELKDWLGTEESAGAGWKNADSEETIGHESGRKIMDILKRNPEKDPEKYTEDDIKHMRKVVSYCARHLGSSAEKNALETKSVEELEKTKSVKSLKNWGHDPLQDRE